MSEVLLLVGEAQSKESSQAIQACNDYLRLGTGRSLVLLHRKYTEHSPGTLPPTRSLRWMKEWSRKYGWVKRAELWDAWADERKTEEYNTAMKSGLALDYERVNSLKRLAAFLEGQIYEKGITGRYHNVWTPDVKVVGTGEYAEKIDIERFNGAIISQYRGTLDDLAKETGGRINKQEITGADNGPIKFTQIEIGGIDVEKDI